MISGIFYYLGYLPIFLINQKIVNPHVRRWISLHQIMVHCTESFWAIFGTLGNTQIFSVIRLKFYNFTVKTKTNCSCQGSAYGSGCDRIQNNLVSRIQICNSELPIRVLIWILTNLSKNPWIFTIFMFISCCSSMTFWCGSGSADPCLWLMNPDSDPDADPDAKTPTKN